MTAVSMMKRRGDVESFDQASRQLLQHIDKSDQLASVTRIGGIDANLERATEALGRTTPVDRGFAGKISSGEPKAAAMTLPDSDLLHR